MKHSAKAERDEPAGDIEVDKAGSDENAPRVFDFDTDVVAAVQGCLDEFNALVHDPVKAAEAEPDVWNSWAEKIGGFLCQGVLAQLGPSMHQLCGRLGCAEGKCIFMRELATDICSAGPKSTKVLDLHIACLPEVAVSLLIVGSRVRKAKTNMTMKARTNMEMKTNMNTETKTGMTLTLELKTKKKTKRKTKTKHKRPWK